MPNEEKLPAGVYRRKDSKVLWIHYGHRGGNYRESAETNSPRKAAALRELRKAELKMGKFVQPNARRVMLSELYADVLQDYRINHYASIDDLEDRWLKHLQPFFGHLAASDVTTDLCKRYIVQRQESGLADSTINRTLAALKRMFHLATECTPPKVQFVPYIPMLKENNVRTGFVETEARVRLEQACGRIGLWMSAMFEVGCTYGWRHGSLLKMRVKQVDSNANVIRLEPGTTKNKKGLEVTMPRRVRELLIQCIQGKRGEDYLFSRENGMPVRDFRGSWAKVCEEAGLPGLHFHDLRRTAARNMRRGHVAEKVAMEIGGWKTTSVFHRYAIVDHQDIANAMEMLERSQDEQRQRLEAGLVAKAEMRLAYDVGSQKSTRQSATRASSEKSALTSRLRHVEGSAGVSGRLHRGTSRTRKPICKRDLGIGAGRGSRTPKTRRSADFESAASASSAIPALRGSD
jgi:integrase